MQAKYPDHFQFYVADEQLVAMAPNPKECELIQELLLEHTSFQDRQPEGGSFGQKIQGIRPPQRNRKLTQNNFLFYLPSLLPFLYQGENLASFLRLASDKTLDFSRLLVIFFQTQKDAFCNKESFAIIHQKIFHTQHEYLYGKKHP